MNSNEVSRIESRLQEERARVTNVLSRIEESATTGTDEDGDLTRYPMHPADQGTDTQDQEQALALLSQESERLTLIDAALERLARDPEGYDKCEACGEKIPAERLDLIPWTRYCLVHQSQSEEAAGA
jgi:RNA polymerase-binding transcription factor DksA